MKCADYTSLCWVLREKDPRVSACGRQYRFDFRKIRSQTLRRQLQRYVWENYRSGKKTLATLRQEHSNLRYYEAWLYERGRGSLAQLRRADAEGFPAYLSLIRSKKSGQPLRRITQKHIYDTVRSVYCWYAQKNEHYGRLYGYFPTDVYAGISRETRILSASCGQAEQLFHALLQSPNPCLRHGMFILLSTGIAPSDVLALRADALQYRPQGIFLRFYHHRKRRYRTIPVSAACARAIEAQNAQTKQLRSSAGRRYQDRLFLYCTRTHDVIPPSPDMFRYWLRQLAAQTDRTELTGQRVTCTAFRYLLTQELQREYIPSFIIQELTGCRAAAERRDTLCI